jgi:cytochrome c-type biogenesis protein CcmE
MFKHKKFIIGGVIVVLAALVLGYVGFMGTGTYYYNVSEFNAKESTLSGQTVRVSGIVDPSVPPVKDGFTYRFTLLDVSDPNAKLEVVYNGPTPPDTFKIGQQAVVEGKFDSVAGVFDGSSIIVKCASKQPAAT